MRLNPKKTNSMMISRSRISAPGYDDFILGRAELEEVKTLVIRAAIKGVSDTRSRLVHSVLNLIKQTQSTKLPSVPQRTKLTLT